jgi:hypothetical protein
MSLSDPWAIDKLKKEQIERDLFKKLGMSIDLYGQSNADQVPLCFKPINNIDSEMINEIIPECS